MYQRAGVVVKNTFLEFEVESEEEQYEQHISPSGSRRGRRTHSTPPNCRFVYTSSSDLNCELSRSSVTEKVDYITSAADDREQQNEVVILDKEFVGVDPSDVPDSEDTEEITIPFSLLPQPEN